ncbi:MAG: hypothetical protein IPM48_03890 [Saprospiraceae bacterium]|nr:hypothetical protein [Saprospiraceae bacterium]
MKKSNHLLILVFLMCILFFASCHSDKAVIREPKGWCVLIDMSGVRNNPAMRKQYAENFVTIMQKMGEGDELAVAFITETSANELNFLVNTQLPNFESGTTNKDRIKKARKKFKKSLEESKSRITRMVQDTILLSQRVSPATEILSALQVAASVFKIQKNSTKTLILLSDMEEYSKAYKFTQEDFTDDRIQKIIDIESKKPQGIPSLDNVNVYVAGANSANTDRFFKVKKFWMEYFKTCRALLQDEHYAATLNGL